MSEEKYTEAVDGILNSQPKTNEVSDDIKIKRGKVDAINIYEVSESELSVIESGAPSSLFLNFVTFFGGIFLSFLSVLCTVEFDFEIKIKLVVFISFLLIDIVTGFLTLIMLIIWLRKRKDLPIIINRIKERIK